MAEPPVTLSVDNDNYDFHTRFSEIIDQLRLKNRSDTHHGLLNPNQIANIEFTRAITQNQPFVLVKMRLDSYYLIGFQRLGNCNDRELYEFKDDSEGHEVHALENSRLLGYNVRYPNLINRPMGIGNFVGAAWGLRNNAYAQKNLTTIALTISESVRFRLISEHFITIFRTGKLWELEPWMDEMVHNWELLSKGAREYAASTGLREADLPVTPDAMDIELMEIPNFELFKGRDVGPKLCAVHTMKLIHLPAV